MQQQVKQAITELLTVVLALAFSVNYKAPGKLRELLESPEFTAFAVFAILYLQLGQDPLRAGMWSLAWFLVDRHFRNEEKAS